MDEADLLETIESTEPLESTDEAREVLVAVAEALGERLTDGEAEDLAATLPEVAAAPLREAEPGEAESFSTEEFLERVRTRAEFDAEPLPAVRAAVVGLREAADAAELDRAREQLPGEFDYLFEPGQPMDAETFLERVADGLPGDVDPRDATEATLRTLGERITGGEAVDLATYLPRDLRGPLLDVDEGAETFDRATFRERVAVRADVDESEATDVARAVVAAVREAAPDLERERVRTQLPDEYDPLFSG